ncbi:hypothetical protein M2480_001410 [Parabacteroides sp. PFB2-12]|uniref:hypothetical protein n=1 Tax=unclassified Parabacteroides TaxID=2649774 RepID=UPI0024736A4E|nr:MULTISPECIES: hypothetical protein [unclassified Parabacteroides]MDH6343050.1 hypothetical protein [Parabacteroides sp. PM6-13]MDH6390437.1 hypothetical protein [Parabacteroides sp. PFB2-12]
MKPSTKTWIDIADRPSLHLFNPGYEPGLLPGNQHYMAPKNVCRMREELALLPLWYAEEDDYVWIEHSGSLDFLAGVPAECFRRATPVSRRDWEGETSLPPLQAAPWGLSPQSICFLEELSEVPGRDLIVPPWQEAYATLAKRQTAAHCLDKMRQRARQPLPEAPCFLSSVEELKAYITTHTPPFVLKMPLSSSGRGLLRLDDTIPEKEGEWINGALRKQGSLSIEKRYQKVRDFALEYQLDARGDIVYHGISLFETAGWKTYCGNLLAGQAEMEGEIADLVGKEALEEIKTITPEVLQELFGGLYTGYLGVDMMVYTDEEGHQRIHPCVEINMRYTMGMVAIRLAERLVDPSAKGVFQVVYEPDAWRKHQEMEKTHSPIFRNGKLCKGYLSLCPVGSNTHYRAFVLLANS